MQPKVKDFFKYLQLNKGLSFIDLGDSPIIYKAQPGNNLN